MEFFHEPKIDWMGVKWYFITLSLALALVGIGSMVYHKGLVYGIDFRGGTVVNVKLPKLRMLTASAGNSTVQACATPRSNNMACPAITS